MDFLFTLLSLPVGTVTRLLSKDGMVGLGTFGKLYEGVENLSDTYMQPYLDKDILACSIPRRQLLDLMSLVC